MTPEARGDTVIIVFDLIGLIVAGVALARTPATDRQGRLSLVAIMAAIAGTLFWFMAKTNWAHWHEPARVAVIVLSTVLYLVAIIFASRWLQARRSS